MNDEMTSSERRWIVCENSQMKKKFTGEEKNSQMKSLHK